MQTINDYSDDKMNPASFRPAPELDGMRSQNPHVGSHFAPK